MKTEGDSDSSDDFGPRPLLKSESAENIKSVKPRPKKRKVEFEKVFLSKLPTAERYEKSYMHRDVVTQIVVSLSADFIVTGSIDGHLKFWKKMPEEVEFVKHFHAHLGALHCLALGSCGRRLASTGADRAVKCYDVVAFDMTDFMECQEFTPTAAAWVHHPGELKGRLAVAEAEGPKIRIYYGEGLVDTNPLAVISVHSSPVVVLAFSLEKQAAVSTDRKGMIEYWDCEKNSNYAFPEAKVQFRYKMDTDLFELAKARTRASCISFSTDGSRMAVISLDKQVRVFDWEKGKLQRIYDERIQVFDAASAAGTLKLDSIDYGRRTAVEREMEESDAMNYQNCTFDDSGNFLIYSTLLGIKVVNVTTNQLSRVLGRHENNERFLHVSLYQGIPKVDSQFLLKREKKSKMAEELNKVAEMDPTVFCTAFKKRRFYMFTNREPVELAGDAENGRDVFNEKPTAEEQVAVFTSSARQLGQEAIIRTTMGDIHIKLYHQECPRTVENFSEHSRNGYYDGLIFHRVIKGFMIQTGDPLGDGTGGESIWGGEFEDEFHRNLRHDRPFTVSMANAGPNTNGSQFFITTVPCPWLDNKHTVFGRVTKGMEACQAIEGMKVDRFDKPYEEIKIINVDIT